MALRGRTPILLLAVIAGGAQVRAQDPVPGTEPDILQRDSLGRQSGASILFERNLNTFNWVGRALYDTSFGGTRLHFSEAYAANIIQVELTPAFPRSRQQSSQQSASLHILHPLTSAVGASFDWSSLVFSDDRGTGLNNASNQTFLAGTEFSPLWFLTLAPKAGYRWDNQQGFHDRGVSLDMAATLRELDADGYRLGAAAQFHEDRLDPRRLDSHFARGLVQKSFSPWTRDSLAFSIGRTRRDFYALADSNIESRIENTFAVNNLLAYDIDRNLGLSVFAGMSSRSLDKDLHPFGPAGPRPTQFDTHIDEVHLDTYVESGYHSDDNRTAAWLRLSHAERTEMHNAVPISNAPPNVVIQYNDRNTQEQTKNNISRRTSLSGSLGFPVSRADAVSLSGAVSILRYDTPSSLNVEDRDEQLIALTLATTHRISRYLDLGVTLEGTESHLVYLLNERSANNNINRVLRLAPNTRYSAGDWLVSVNAFEVLANYTVYDFEQLPTQAQSFSYREFGWLDSTRIELTSRVGVDVFWYLKSYERGQFNWDAFSERIENSFIERTAAVQARFSPSSGSLFAAGVRYFSQSRFGYGAVGKHLEAFLRSFGPTCMIFWELGSHSRVDMRGWYENRKAPDGSTTTLISMMLNLNFTF